MRLPCRKKVRNGKPSLTRACTARKRHLPLEIPLTAALAHKKHFSFRISVARECERDMIAAFRTGISAAQNGPVTRICPNCRALLLTSTENCSFCHPPAETPADAEARAKSNLKTPGKISGGRKLRAGSAITARAAANPGHEDAVPHAASFTSHVWRQSQSPEFVPRRRPPLRPSDRWNLRSTRAGFFQLSTTTARIPKPHLFQWQA